MEWTERDALLVLNALRGMGPGKVSALVQAAGSAAAAVGDPARWFSAARVGRPPQAAELVRRLEQERNALEACGAEPLTWADPGYPEHLRHLQEPPPVLAVRGAATALAGGEARVAVVGARACTGYGRVQATRFGAGLAAGGAVVISGAARGIDRHAMEGAFRAGGRVVAVLGSGLDRPYPPESVAFLDEVAGRGGAVISEFPCGMSPTRGNFPRRNRILAALADGVLVVQAAGKSGSMITVGWALHLGREVFAVPGEVDCAASHGPHRLLRDGATLVEDPREILGHLASRHRTAPEPDSLVLAALAAGDRSLDELTVEIDQPYELLLLDLCELELRGRVQRLPGGIYHRCGPRNDSSETAS